MIHVIIEILIVMRKFFETNETNEKLTLELFMTY